MLPGDFYEDDEPVAEVEMAFDRGTPAVSRSVEELAAEQGISGPQPLDSLANTTLTDEERQAFVEEASAHPRGWFCQHMSITSSLVVGLPVVGCGCKMEPLARGMKSRAVTGGGNPQPHDGKRRNEPQVGPRTPSGVSSSHRSTGN